MTLAEKVRILRENREWTQETLAEHLSLSPDVIQEWESEKKDQSLKELRRLADVFFISASSLIDEAIEFPVFYRIGSLSPVEFHSGIGCTDSTDHIVYDAALRNGATLHRFLNNGGCPYSAIYIGTSERMSCERGREQGMIDYWNQMGDKGLL